MKMIKGKEEKNINKDIIKNYGIDAKNKNQINSGITLIALVITIIVLLILAGVTIATLTGPNGIITRANEAKEATEQAKQDELARLQSIEDYISSVSPSTDGYNETEGVNSPKLAKGMIPIKYNGTNWVVCAETDEDWYQYDTTNKKWANVMLSDGTYKAGQVGEGQVVQESELGSMFVWIPRYAYQITKGYQQGSTATEKEINVTFLAGNTNQDKDGNSYGKATASVNTSTTKVVHPGFTLGQRELTGIWVAKFEASGTNASGEAVGNGTSGSSSQENAPDETTIVKSLPSKISWRYITTGDAQKRCMDITTTNKDMYGIDYASSHLMKNSEWGAVAYLSYSQYGEVPQINGAGSYGSKDGSGWYYDLYTGAGPNANEGKETDDDRYEDFATTKSTRAYDKELGKLASTTGNATGVYDMSGGAWDKVAGYLDNGDSYLSSFGGNYFEEKGTNKGGQKYYGVKEEYASLWDAYQVSEEEKEDQIKIDDTETLTKSALWNWDKRDLKYQQARQRITQETFNKFPNGIGVTEMATEFSFYAPYTPGTEDNTQPWNWFKTPEQAVAGTPSGATTWDGDLVYIGYAHIPFVMRGGYCNGGGGAGVLYTNLTSGDASYNGGFRPVVVL